MASKEQQAGDGDDAPFTINAQEIAKLLECPVRLEVMTPPITLCKSGHAICHECRKAVKTCQTCRDQFTGMRCRFAESLLDKCTMPCSYREAGCKASVLGGKLAKHQESCDYRPLTCPVGTCAKEILYDKFLDHLRNEDKLTPWNAMNFQMTCWSHQRFYFDAEKRNCIEKSLPCKWLPAWIRAYNRSFFCFVEKTAKSQWFIRVCLFGTAEECGNYKCSITTTTFGNDWQWIELKYVGKMKDSSHQDVKRGCYSKRLLPLPL